MKKLLFLFFVMVFFSSCPDKKSTLQEGSDKVDVSSNTITAGDIEQIKILEFGLSADGKKLTEDWTPFQTLNTEIENLNSGDLTYFQQDPELLQTQFKELRTSLPDTLKSKPVEARLLAFETKLYMMNNELNLQNFPKEEKIQSIKEFLIAYSNLVLQMNKKLELDANINVQKSLNQ